jgi:hypothetical protein
METALSLSCCSLAATYKALVVNDGDKCVASRHREHLRFCYTAVTILSSRLSE